MEKKINLNYDKFEEKYPFDENAYIQALCKHLLENLSATVAKKKAEKGLKNKELIQVKNLTPSTEDAEDAEDGRAVTNLVNCQIVKSRNPWLVSDTNLKIIADNLNSTPYKLLWDNGYTTMGLSNSEFKTSHYIKSGHHVNPVSLEDLFRFGINYLLDTKYKSLVNKALELYGAFTYAEYFDKENYWKARREAIDFVFEDVKGHFLAEQKEFFSSGSTSKLNKQLKEFYEQNLVKLLQSYVEIAPQLAFKIVDAMKETGKIAERVRRGKEEIEQDPEDTYPTFELDETLSVLENFENSSENLLKLLVSEQNESMIDPNNEIKGDLKYFGENKK